MRRPVNKFFVPCTLVAVLLSPLGVAATVVASGDEIAQRNVSFADLDLTHREGVVSLYSRIKSAARDVCEPNGSRALKMLLLASQCKKRAIFQAVSDVHSPELTNYHMSMTNRMDLALLNK